MSKKSDGLADESKPIAADAWENGRWKVEWSEMPLGSVQSRSSGNLPPGWARRHPVRCLWCGRELQSNVIARRNAFIEEHSHSDFPNLPDSIRRQAMKIVTVRERVDLDLIDDNPWQPREEITPESAEEMADDIRRIGRLLQTPLARRAGGGRYQLAFGHRRIAGCRFLRQLGEWGDYVDLDVDDLPDEQMALIALSENVQRKQLTGLEIARAWKKAVDDTDLTVQTLADKVGVSRPHMSNNLRVLELPACVLEHIDNGGLSMSVAREFLVLQHSTHTHLDDMEHIVRSITSVFGGRGQPDWTRRHVRERICERVNSNESDWRPLGPSTANAKGQARTDTTFDVDEFKKDCPDSLHTIPAVSSIERVNYEPRAEMDDSRLWTCEVKEWGRRQSRATREANKAAREAGETPGEKRRDAGSREARLAAALSNDPIWRGMVADKEARGIPVPTVPAAAEDLEEMGTRAKLQDLFYNHRNNFWKRLVKAGKDDSPRQWEDEDGGALPPYFADLKGCQTCTAGAAYYHYPGFANNGRYELGCFNKRCYTQKAKAGADQYREKLEAHKKGLFREDREAAQGFAQRLESFDRAALRALAVALVAETRGLGLQHPFGSYAAEWSYEAGATSRTRELLGLEPVQTAQGVRFWDGDGLRALDGVADVDLRELVSNLLTHHLRQAGRLDLVSQETES